MIENERPLAVPPVNPPASPAQLPEVEEEAAAPVGAKTGWRAWISAGARILSFRSPDWSTLTVHPFALAGVIALSYLMLVATQRGFLSGEVRFYPRGFLNGWLELVVMLWLCWWVARSHPARDAPQASAPLLLMALSVANLLMLPVLGGAMLLGHHAVAPLDEWPTWVRWTVYLFPLIWVPLAQLWTLWKVAGTAVARGLALLLIPLATVLGAQVEPIVFWWPERSSKEVFQGLTVDDEVVFAQPELLAKALDAVQPPQPGQVNLYSVTYAPYASQDVFMNESRVVTETMENRFGARGHSVQLVLNPATNMELPWAVPTTLQKTLKRIGAVMDRDRDVLFLHLTSHGARSGELAVDSWPLTSEAITPALLRQWLDEAGIRYRVISVSACYSGSWLEPLANDNTLVMTAADATHTSYGCGSRSPLTFFGQAMYVDALAKTHSFETAHAQARKLIDEREKAAGKSDGYSNPQLRMGRAVKPVLDRLAAELERP